MDSCLFQVTESTWCKAGDEVESRPKRVCAGVDWYAGQNRPQGHFFEAKHQCLYIRRLFRCPCQSLVLSQWCVLEPNEVVGEMDTAYITVALHTLSIPLAPILYATNIHQIAIII